MNAAWEEALCPETEGRRPASGPGDPALVLVPPDCPAPALSIMSSATTAPASVVLSLHTVPDQYLGRRMVGYVGLRAHQPVTPYKSAFAFEAEIILTQAPAPPTRRLSPLENACPTPTTVISEYFPENSPSKALPPASAPPRPVITQGGHMPTVWA